MTFDPGLAAASKRAIGLRLLACGPVVASRGKAVAVGSGGTNSLPEGLEVGGSERGHRDQDTQQRKTAFLL